MTALHPARRDRVRIELDGVPWRTFPAAAVVAAGLRPGLALDRERARALARAVRRSEALELAASALSRRDRSVADLSSRLERRGVAAAERVEAIETMTHLGVLDDRRFAADRAASLERRGYGDEAIRFELGRQGIGGEQIAAAIEGLVPELERARAIVAEADRAGRGSGTRTGTRAGATAGTGAAAEAARTARRLTAKGFSAGTIESVVGEPAPD